MKRFITYLYECQRGNKSKNVGFIRVNVRGEETSMEVYIRNQVKLVDKGKIYVLIYKQQLLGIELGEVKIENGQCDSRIQVQTTDVCDSGFALSDIEGVGVCLDSGLYIASCWKDELADEIVRGEFKVQNQSLEEEIEIESSLPLVAAEEKMAVVAEPYLDKEPSTIYEKIDLSQIRDLPSPNWHLATNSFLVHGFWNYGYLVLKKDFEEGKKILSLGVPGIYEKPEAVMAVLFGFPNFEVVPQDAMDVQKEKNQETVDGTLGCWFVNLKI